MTNLILRLILALARFLLWAHGISDDAKVAVLETLIEDFIKEIDTVDSDTGVQKT